MKATIFGLLAETSIHPGSGQDTGFVDLPVAREAATDYPVLVGSSLKGALRDRARQDAEAGESDISKEVINKVFGEQDSAGTVLVGDGRLILLPVRSLTSSYRWATCPHLLERFARDARRAGLPLKKFDSPKVETGKYLGAGGSELYLEERQFSRAGDLPPGLANVLSSLVLHEDTGARLEGTLVILHDDDFAWFARFGLAVNARNVLDEVKKTSKNLWYEETLPPDTLLYCLLAERGPGGLDSVTKLFESAPYIQAGGNETVGQGWFAVRAYQGGQ